MYTEDNFEELLKTCFFTKDKSFEYENEMRLLKYTKNLEKDYLPINFDYIKRIVFGKRCDSDMKDLISCINMQVYKNKLELYEIDEHFREVKYNDR